MFEIENCQNCGLSKTAKPASRCLKGEGGVGARLAIYIDHPNYLDDRRCRSFVSEPADLLRWMLRRMSITPDKVYLDYVVKCYPGKKLPQDKSTRFYCVHQCNQFRIATLQKVFPREIVGFGGLALEAFTGHSAKQMKHHANCWWPPSDPRVASIVNRVWIGYSIGYAYQSPGEAHSQFGLLWMAAEHAGLEPKIDEKVRPFKFPI